MLIVVLMFVLGLLAAVWGFLMCFFPARWERLTETISFADRWTMESPKRLQPIIRLGNRAAGLVIFCVGCWFAYLASSGIYRVITGQAAIENGTQAVETLPKTSTTGLDGLSVFVIAAGVLMALFPAKSVRLLERVWPAGRSVTPSSAPKLMLFIRVFGAILALLAALSLAR